VLAGGKEGKEGEKKLSSIARAWAKQGDGSLRFAFDQKERTSRRTAQQREKKKKREIREEEGAHEIPRKTAFLCLKKERRTIVHLPANEKKGGKREESQTRLITRS